MIDRIIKFLSRPKWHTFSYSGNMVKSNKPVDDVIKSLQVTENTSVTVIYTKTRIKHFDPMKWHIHGNDILSNCVGIKVILD